MVDATITESTVFSLKQGVVKGTGMYVARLQVDDGETLTPGFKHIRAILMQTYADVAATWHICAASAHPANAEAGAQITFSVGDIDAYADAASTNYYALIIGDNTAGTT